jgi:hypothetical protein
VTEFTQPGPRSKLLWLAVDLDNTLALPVWTADNPVSEIGDPIWANVSKLGEAVMAGYKVVIHTARPWTDYEAIESWLEHWHIPWHKILPGKILAALYIDDRGRHSDAESWIP